MVRAVGHAVLGSISTASFGLIFSQYFVIRPYMHLLCRIYVWSKLGSLLACLCVTTFLEISGVAFGQPFPGNPGSLLHQDHVITVPYMVLGSNREIRRRSWILLPTYTGEYILHICKDLSLGPSKVQLFEVSFDRHVFRFRFALNWVCLDTHSYVFSYIVHFSVSLKGVSFRATGCHVCRFVWRLDIFFFQNWACLDMP